MNIVVFGAGAIGSLFGGLLSKNNNVVLIGRKKHVDTINKNGLTIERKTNLNIKIQAEDNIKKISFIPDLVILTTKSYDTKSAIAEVKKHINDETYILSLQNGLNNLEIINRYIDSKRTIGGVTTHGCVFPKPGFIRHTGYGDTIIGNLEKNDEKTKEIVGLLNDSGIKTNLSNDIARDIWIKGIVNSSINPITAFFECKNGYLLENAILENIVEKICYESTNTANALGMNLKLDYMVEMTKNVINNTSENFSSMLQSIKQGKKTEIDSINRKIVEIGKGKKIDVSLNELLVYLIKSNNF